jgi:hypothetical protein
MQILGSMKLIRRDTTQTNLLPGFGDGDVTSDKVNMTCVTRLHAGPAACDDSRSPIAPTANGTLRQPFPLLPDTTMPLRRGASERYHWPVATDTQLLPSQETRHCTETNEKS